MTQTKKGAVTKLITGLVIGSVVLVTGVVVTRPLWLPYFQTQQVNEELPLSAAQLQVLETLRIENSAMADQTLQAMQLPDTMVMEEMAEDEVAVTLVGEGVFQGFDAIHQGSGAARLITTSSTRLLRLEDFEVTNGPQLHVYLSTQDELTLTGGLGEGALDLGPLKGNQGNQNYVLPEGVDLTQFKSVAIYCVPFNVTFAWAGLK